MPVRYKVRDILRILKEDGWVLVRIKGSHHFLKHPVKKNGVTVPVHGLNDEVRPGTAASIFRQAELTLEERKK